MHVFWQQVWNQPRSRGRHVPLVGSNIRDHANLISTPQTKIQYILVRRVNIKGVAPDISYWTVICTANWSWHSHQPAPVVKKNKPQSTFYKDAPFTKLQEKTCGLSALPWWPNSMAANRSWRRRRHSSPERPWSCRLRTPRRRWRTSKQ